jgi:hypothetical protein
VTLKKALDDYEAAMKLYNRAMIFKHLYVVLEFMTNWNEESSGSKLDSRMSELWGISLDKVSTWKTFYNRTKHIDDEGDKLIKYVKGLEGIPNELGDVRRTAQVALLDRLKKL